MNANRGTDTTHLRIRDAYTNRVLPVRTAGELEDWLVKSYATLTNGQREMVQGLMASLAQGDDEDIKWYGVACDLVIEAKKKTRKKRK